MFSGIIEDLGEVKKISRRSKVTLFEIDAGLASRDIRIGDSVSVNGVCLTLVKNDSGRISFEVMPETLKVTNLGDLKIKDRVNLERALKIGDRLSGHFVSGHIDCLGIIRRKNYLEGNLAFEIVVPEKLSKNIIVKGSVSVDGISLTIANKKSNSFIVYIIPHTLKQTTLGFKGPSDRVNIEFDLLRKQST